MPVTEAARVVALRVAGALVEPRLGLVGSGARQRVHVGAPVAVQIRVVHTGAGAIAHVRRLGTRHPLELAALDLLAPVVPPHPSVAVDIVPVDVGAVLLLRVLELVDVLPAAVLVMHPP